VEVPVGRSYRLDWRWPDARGAGLLQAYLWPPAGRPIKPARQEIAPADARRLPHQDHERRLERVIGIVRIGQGLPAHTQDQRPMPADDAGTPPRPRRQSGWSCLSDAASPIAIGLRAASPAKRWRPEWLRPLPTLIPRLLRAHTLSDEADRLPLSDGESHFLKTEPSNKFAGTPRSGCYMAVEGAGAG
jgi:hypothetical protein